jgi:putative Mg2+ transporter-C (MgtC) family protein
VDFDELLTAAFWIRLGVALACGAAIGLERQLRGKPAGMRTSMLVCLGTVLYIRLGVALDTGHSDPARVLGQVVTGIGFLGAGVILTRGGQVLGITSAAVMWVLAAIGSAAAFDRIGAALATTVVTVMILVGLNALERASLSLQRGVHANAMEETPPPPGVSSRD